MSKKKQHIEYAIVDIETTGGNASGSRITEIAIVIHDGTQIIDRFETLVNPEKEIPFPIFALTGINNEMVSNAPVFGDIAERVHSMLENRIFVAHNVNFDYSFVKQQLDAEGYNFSVNKLCTVRISRKIKPGFRSYSLGNLCENLSIPIQNRHRAGGDAEATAVLFSKLLEWDSENVIPQMLKRNSKEQQLPANLPKEDFTKLPDCPGVYYFRDQAHKIIYVGKAVNIKKRVASHFTGHNPNPQRQHFLQNIHGIAYEACATELMSLLLECVEIKRLWPSYNRALKRFEPKFGLFMYRDRLGYDRLVLGKPNKLQPCLQFYTREYDGINDLLDLINEFGIDIRFCHFGKQEIPFDVSINKEIKPLPSVDEHNSLLENALERFHKDQPTFAIMDKGRNVGEKSCIWVEKGNFYAMGYIENNSDLNTAEDIKNSLQRYPGNHYMMQLINSFIQKNPNKIVWFSHEDSKVY